MTKKPAIKWPAADVQMVKVESLVPYEKNSRVHPEAQIKQICESIKEWGFTIPILIDEQGGVIAGHGRVMAATELGLKEIPAMTAHGWSEDQKRAYVIADNKLALNAEWDNNLLRDELGDLETIGFNIDKLGFSIVEIDALLGSDGDVDFDAEWEGMPSYESDDLKPYRQIIVSFEGPKAVDDFVKRLGIIITDKTKSTFFPQQAQADMSAIAYESD